LLRLIVCSFALPKTRQNTLFFLWVFFAGMFEVLFLFVGLDLSFSLGSVGVSDFFCFYESGSNFVQLASFKNCNFFLSLVFVGLAYQGKGYCV
jgi:hypothetical protein